MRLIFLCFAVIFLQVRSADPKCPRSYTYQKDLNTCICNLQSYAPWTWAVNDCKDQFGGSLPSIHSAFENSIFAQVQKNLTGDPQGWLGAQKGPDGVWTWIDGTPFDYQRFAQTNDTVSDCAYFDSADQTWKLQSCRQESQWFSFLCVKSPIPPDVGLE